MHIIVPEAMRHVVATRSLPDDCVIVNWEALGSAMPGAGARERWKLAEPDLLIVFPCTSKLSRMDRGAAVSLLAAEARRVEARVGVILPDPLVWKVGFESMHEDTRPFYEARSASRGTVRRRRSRAVPEPLDGHGQFLMDELIALLRDFAPEVSLERLSFGYRPNATTDLGPLKRYLKRHHCWYVLHVVPRTVAPPGAIDAFGETEFDSPSDASADSNWEAAGADAAGTEASPAERCIASLARLGPPTRDAVAVVGRSIILPFSRDTFTGADVANVSEMLSLRYEAVANGKANPTAGTSAARRCPWCLEEVPGSVVLNVAGVAIEFEGHSADIIKALGEEAGSPHPAELIDLAERGKPCVGSGTFRRRIERVRSSFEKAGLPRDMVRFLNDQGYVLMLDPKRKRSTPDTE